MKNNKLINNVQDQGYVIIKKLFSNNEIDKILIDLETIKEKVSKTKQRKFSHKTHNGKFNTIHNINEFIRSGKVIDLSKSRRILRPVEILIKGKSQLRNIEFFLKPSKNKMMTPFHQDNYFWNVIGARAVNIWIACSESSKKNGGVCYLEKSHKLGTINHVISYKKGTSQKIPDFILKSLKFKRVYPSLNKGDAIIHNCEVIHGSYENNSSKNRVGLVFSYKAKDAKYDKSRIDLYHKKLKENLIKIYKSSHN